MDVRPNVRANSRPSSDCAAQHASEAEGGARQAYMRGVGLSEGLGVACECRQRPGGGVRQYRVAQGRAPAFGKLRTVARSNCTTASAPGRALREPAAGATRRARPGKPAARRAPSAARGGRFDLLPVQQPQQPRASMHTHQAASGAQRRHAHPPAHPVEAVRLRPVLDQSRGSHGPALQLQPLVIGSSHGSLQVCPRPGWPRWPGLRIGARRAVKAARRTHRAWP